MNGEQDESLDEAPRDSHWHWTMVRQRIWDICDIRAIGSFLFCLVNVFNWWWWVHIKLPLVAVTVVIFVGIEMRRITPEIAIRQFMAWLRGPDTPGVATRSLRSLGDLTRPRLATGRGQPRSET